jgi:hypothetical protein
MRNATWQTRFAFEMIIIYISTILRGMNIEHKTSSRSTISVLEKVDKINLENLYLTCFKQKVMTK